MTIEKVSGPAYDPEELDALDILSAQYQQKEAQAEPASPEEMQRAQEQEQANAQAMAMMEAGAVAVVSGLLKVARYLIDKKLNLPEIREEWSDEVLQEPAKAAIPLLKKHFSKLMEIAGSSPETAVFAMSLIPLAMGVVSAMDKRQAREDADRKRTVDTVAADAG